MRIYRMLLRFGALITPGLFFYLLPANPTPTPAHLQTGIGLNFLDEYVVPFNLAVNGTTAGGFSGIGYDPEKEIYYVISDDRSHINPARFYTIAIDLSGDKIDTVRFLTHTFLKQMDGSLFPDASAGLPAIDPESIRLWNEKIIWSSEGERRAHGPERNPEIYIAGLNGLTLDTLPVPAQMRTNGRESGVRNNGGFEGLSVDPAGKFLFASVEEPLLQDGPRAGLGDSTGIVRIIKYDLPTRKAIAQFAYEIDPVAHPVTPPSGFRLNGISEILCLDENRLLVVERSFSMGRFHCTIKVFVAVLSDADDVSTWHSLKGKSYQKVQKDLILNMDDLGRFVDNIEGVTFGPRLANGNPSLIFIADNNFLPLQKSQIFLFELLNHKGSD